MIEVSGTYERLSFRPDGDAEITFRIPANLRGSLMAGIDRILESGVKDLCIRVGRKKKKRSLDMNSYAWQLITQIAEKLQDSKVLSPRKMSIESTSVWWAFMSLWRCERMRLNDLPRNGQNVAQGG